MTWRRVAWWARVRGRGGGGGGGVRRGGPSVAQRTSRAGDVATHRRVGRSRIVDAIQAEVGEGPCVDAVREPEVFVTGDLTSERWPQFSRRAHDETGVMSILSIRLFVERDTMGALNLYSRAADAFDASDVALAAVFATHAAMAMTAARREANLERKAESRISSAGPRASSCRCGTSATTSFDLLRQASQQLNIKLSAVATGQRHRRTPERRRVDQPTRASPDARAVRRVCTVQAREH